MTADRCHMDPSTIEMVLILKYNRDVWSARTIDTIINKEIRTLTGQKRAFAALVDMGNCNESVLSVSELDRSFWCFVV